MDIIVAVISATLGLIFGAVLELLREQFKKSHEQEQKPRPELSYDIEETVFRTQDLPASGKVSILYDNRTASGLHSYRVPLTNTGNTTLEDFSLRIECGEGTVILDQKFEKSEDVEIGAATLEVDNELALKANIGYLNEGDGIAVTFIALDNPEGSINVRAIKPGLRFIRQQSRRPQDDVTLTTEEMSASQRRLTLYMVSMMALMTYVMAFAIFFFVFLQD